MAGETPGAAASRRRRLPWAEDRSTNKIYASGDISALGDNTTVADSPLKPGQVPAANPTPVIRADDRSADKYYAHGGSQRVRGPQVAKQQKAAKLGPPPPLAPTRSKRPATPTVRELNTVATKDDINGVLVGIADRLRAGETGIVLFVKHGASDLLKRTRAALELLVTREVLTEEQYHEVRISYEAAPTETAELNAVFGPPAPTKTVRTEDNESIDDPLAFLGGGDDEPPVSTDAVATTPVDTSADPAPDDGDDADNDFLNPVSPAATVDVPAAPAADAAAESADPPAEEVPAADDKPAARGGRRRR